ncbi:proline racemase family protein [Nonomuraea sp. NPDC049400]|uniref:proline racemase family protein n=1 Tax=Nonomuraea sp. NPDC049400 TaxID=3364352 RepID=UPI0037B44C2C
MAWWRGGASDDEAGVEDELAGGEPVVIQALHRRAHRERGHLFRVLAHGGRGRLQMVEPLVHESITGEIFTSVPVEKVQVGAFDGVCSRITGRAYVTGTAEWTVDPRDPLGAGFLVP